MTLLFIIVLATDICFFFTGFTLGRRVRHTVADEEDLLAHIKSLGQLLPWKRVKEDYPQGRHRAPRWGTRHKARLRAWFQKTKPRTDKEISNGL